MSMARRVMGADGKLFCPTCGIRKLPAEFGRDASRWDGLGLRCKICQNRVTREARRRAGPERVREWGRSRAKRSSGPAQRAWQAAHRDKVRVFARARAAVQRALKAGVLVRPAVCEGCGRTGCPIEAAHSDYAQFLDVRWLCRYCHRLWDNHDPKSAALSDELLAPMKRGPKPKERAEGRA